MVWPLYVLTNSFQKNPRIRTVVNKLNTIHAQFRFFDMELIAGEPDFIVHHVSNSLILFMLWLTSARSESRIVTSPLISGKCIGTHDWVQNMIA